MALEDIINKIELEANNKIQEIESEKEKTISHLKEKKLKELAKRKKEVLDETDELRKKMIAKARFEAINNTKDKLTEKKFSIINGVYSKVLGQLKNLNKEDYLKLINHYWEKNLPKGEYQILIADNRENETLDFFRLKGVEVVGKVKSVGGFIIKTDSLEIDNTFEAVMNQIRIETEPEVVKILFK